MKGDCTLRWIEHEGSGIFCGKVKRRTRRPGQQTRQRTMLQTTKSMVVDALAGTHTQTHTHTHTHTHTYTYT